MLKRKPSTATVLAALALFFSLGENALAADNINVSAPLETEAHVSTTITVSGEVETEGDHSLVYTHCGGGNQLVWLGVDEELGTVGEWAPGLRTGPLTFSKHHSIFDAMTNPGVYTFCVEILRNNYIVTASTSVTITVKPDRYEVEVEEAKKHEEEGRHEEELRNTPTLYVRAYPVRGRSWRHPGHTEIEVRSDQAFALILGHGKHIHTYYMRPPVGFFAVRWSCRSPRTRYHYIVVTASISREGNFRTITHHQCRRWHKRIKARQSAKG
jgi:hypothetical protein